MHYCCVLFVLSDLDFGTLVQLMSCVDFWLRVRVGGCHLSSDLLCFSEFPGRMPYRHWLSCICIFTTAIVLQH